MCHNLRSCAWFYQIIFIMSNYCTLVYKDVQGCTSVYIGVYSIWYRRTDYWNVKSLIQTRVSPSRFCQTKCRNLMTFVSINGFQKFFKRERDRYSWTEGVDGPKESTDWRNQRTEGLIWNGGYIQYFCASNGAWIFELLVFQTCSLRVHGLGWISNFGVLKVGYSMFYFWAYELSKVLSNVQLRSHNLNTEFF